MNKEQKMVWNWHVAMKKLDSNGCYPFIPKNKKINKLRYDLIKEELEEFKVALKKRDIIEVADALGDLLFVVYGAGCQYGIDLEPVFEEIYKSNLTKAGGKVNKKGKITKGKNYKAPNLYKIIAPKIVDNIC